MLQRVKEAISPSRKGEKERGWKEVNEDETSDFIGFHREFDPERRGRTTNRTSTGRGGAGNFIDRSLSSNGASPSAGNSNLKKDLDTDTSNSRSRTRGFGVGGAGNFKRKLSVNPEQEEIEEQVKAREILQRRDAVRAEQKVE